MPVPDRVVAVLRAQRAFLSLRLDELRRRLPERWVGAAAGRTTGALGSSFDRSIDAEASARFAATHPGLAFSSIVVLIPAYNEAASIAGVIGEVPDRVLHHDVSVLVVVDGGDDDTDAVAAKAGATVCKVPRNRGQGAALRLGYWLATTYGAHYIVTLDADGQYFPAEMAILLQPLLDGTADFVQGSRRMGHSQQADAVRMAGVWVFGALISLLLRQRITDSSNGFRAMRAEVVEQVTLREPQYHASELLIGAVRHGFRLVERPVGMRRRSAGVSKKGGNFRYAYHYTRVILSTWWRER